MPNSELKENIKKSTRKHTRLVDVGGVLIGSGNIISIQSMLTIPLIQTDAAIEQAEKLARAGCDIIRVAVPNKRSVLALNEFRKAISTPIVADIHFNYKLAIASAQAGVDKLRINPGNIGSSDKVAEVVSAAKDHSIPIRIGVNAGSLPQDLIDMPDRAVAMVEAAKREIAILESNNFEDIVVSLKSHDVLTTIRSNRLFANEMNIPLHLGVTEAGSFVTGSVKNAIGISTLLLDGIGDTIRVSLTSDPVDEVVVAKNILRSCGLYSKGIELVSCPTCGRKRVDVEAVVNEVEKNLPETDRHVTLAIMGCEVNGPGEAREADIGFAGTAGGFIVFKKGQICGKIMSQNAVSEIIRILKSFLDD